MKFLLFVFVFCFFLLRKLKSIKDFETKQYHFPDKYDLFSQLTTNILNQNNG